MDEVEAGRYRLLERIGSGGMAEVWRARDEQTGDEVAVKRLHPEVLADPGARERFAREIDALRSIDHPLAVRVLDAAVDEHEARLVMERLPGGSLRDRLAGGPLGAAPAARMASDVASVLAAAHAAGVVHRDVSPANIVFDDRGRARLVDYGVASVPEGWGRDAVTATTDVVGTLRFIAPEVLEGGDAEPSADIWALGAVAWEAVAGRPPFEATSPSALLEARREPAPPLDADPVLASLVASMLARDPAQRPTAPTVATGFQRVAADLEAAQGDLTVVMPAPGAPVAWTAPAAVAGAAAAQAGAPEPGAADPGVPEPAPVVATAGSATPAPEAVAAASPASSGWGASPAAGAAAPPSRSSSTSTRARALAGAAIVAIAILAVALVGNPGLTGLPAGAEGTPEPSATAAEPSEPPAEEVDRDGGEGAGPGAGNGNGNGNGNDKAKDGDKPGKGKGRDKGRP